MMRKAESGLAKSEELYSELKNDVDNSKTDLEKKVKNAELNLNKESEKNKNEQKRMQNEYITILGIFAAVVLAFTGGMTFSNSVLNNIAHVSVYRAMLMASIVGIVFFNLIWVLLDFVRNIDGKTIRKVWLF